MGQVFPSRPPLDFESNEANDYNPFNIPSILLDNPHKMNFHVSLTGSPPMHTYDKGTFAKLTLEKKAAYADGVIRGSYQLQWLSNQLNNMWNLEQSTSYVGIGALAYVGLKTNNQAFIDCVNEWSQAHMNDQSGFLDCETPKT